MGGDKMKAKARVLSCPGGSVRPAPSNAAKRKTLGYGTQVPFSASREFRDGLSCRGTLPKALPTPEGPHPRA